jgi:hypothetical protein
MRIIAELNVLLRAPVALPAGLKLATDEFHEGWNFVRTVTAQRLEKKIRKRGWNFIKIEDSLLRSGVGDTSQDAIASALTLALRCVSHHFNGVEVERIMLTRYPWFVLARVRVYPYRIQQSAVAPVPDVAVSMPISVRQRRLPHQSVEPLPHFASAIPILKEMLVSSASSQPSS